LANLLQLIVIGPYLAADAIAVIPGTAHRYSEDLGRFVAIKTGMPLVVLSLEKGSRRFAVDRKESESRTLILIDDVHRTGKTFRDAASCLFQAGAKDVLGLAATCTISRTDLPCHHGHLADDERLRVRSHRENRISVASDYLRRTQEAGGLSPGSAARAIDQLHAEHARWLASGA
jgi:hypothetical protein